MNTWHENDLSEGKMNAENCKQKRPKAVATGFFMESVFGQSVPCYVLDNGKRVLSQRGMVHTLNSKNTEESSGAKDAKIDRFLERLPENFRPNQVGPRIEFDVPKGVANGNAAADLVHILKSYVEAYLAGALHHKQVPIAMNAMRLLSALAGVGIEALIDEATGYQKVREESALEKRMKELLREEAAPWVLVFQPALVQALKPLYGYEWEVGQPHPKHLHHLYSEIYGFVLGKDLYAKLRDLGQDTKRHQHLVEQARNAFGKELHLITALASQSGSRAEFRRRLRSHYTGAPFQLELSP